jgi:hypothetical protein
MNWDPLFISDVILDTIALVIIIILAINTIRDRHITEIRMFFGMCVSTVFLALWDSAKYIYFMVPTHQTWLEDVYITLTNPLTAIVSLVIVVQWLLFVEYSLHQSKDLIRRRFTRVLIPFFISTAVEIIGTVVFVIGGETGSFDLMFMADRVHLLSTAFMFMYMLLTYVIVHQERVRKRLPRYILITPMAVAVLLGYFLDTVTYRSLFALFVATGLISVYFSIRKQHAWEDDNTGYYNKDYLRIIMDYIDEKNIEGGTIIRFSTKNDSRSLAKILHQMEPDNSKTVFMGKGVFLIITDTQTEDVIDWYKKLIVGRAGQDGLDVKADHFLRQDEPPEDFLTKALAGT